MESFGEMNLNGPSLNRFGGKKKITAEQARVKEGL